MSRTAHPIAATGLAALLTALLAVTATSTSTSTATTAALASASTGGQGVIGWD
ncbi:hypothetical protein ACFXKW_32620 [Streptomyces sp. NPDC059193]|uniref:hypothetical protein n=1 Tax=Streptomyces sp. NPDC059193 TaxID=3346763 RepID=UPI0036764750